MANQLFGCYFFMSTDMIQKSYLLATLIDLLSNLGGFIQIFIITFFFVSTKYNEASVINKAIRSLYYDYIDDEESTVIKPLTFNFKDYLKMFLSKCWPSYSSPRLR